MGNRRTSFWKIRTRATWSKGQEVFRKIRMKLAEEEKRRRFGWSTST